MGLGAVSLAAPAQAEAYLVYPKERAVIYKNVCAAYKSKNYTITEIGWYSREWFDKNMPAIPVNTSDSQFLRDIESRSNTSDRDSAIITQSHNLLSEVLRDRKCDPY